MKYSLSKINKSQISENIYYDNDTIILHVPEQYRIETKESNNKIKKYISNSNEKIGVAFVYETMFGNGIGRMLSILFEELAKYEKYDIYLLSKGSYRYDFKVDKKVKQIPIFGNKTKIKKFDESSNVKYYVLHNEIDPNKIN